MPKSSGLPLLIIGGVVLAALALRPKSQTLTPEGSRVGGGFWPQGDISPRQGPVGWGGVGRIEVFPVTPTSSETVEHVSAEMLTQAATSREVEALAEQILAEANLPFQPTLEAARALHRFVNERMPYVADPPDFEHMEDPGSQAAKVLNGEWPAPSDCDDRALLLSAMCSSVGFSASGCFLDVDGDGVIDHAMAQINVPGHGPLMAETTVPGKELGWSPPYAFMECLGV